MTTPAPTKPLPLILDNAGIKIGTGPEETTLVELACVANHIELAPDVSITTIDTFCGTTDYPGNVQWTLNATLFQSFDPGATEDVLSQAVASGGPVPFSIIGYRDQPISDRNPEWSGMLIPQPYSPINGDAGGESTVDLAWSLVGAPTKTGDTAMVLASRGAVIRTTDAATGEAAVETVPA